MESKYLLKDNAICSIISKSFWNQILRPCLPGCWKWSFKHISLQLCGVFLNTNNDSCLSLPFKKWNQCDLSIFFNQQEIHCIQLSTNSGRHSQNGLDVWDCFRASLQPENSAEGLQRVSGIGRKSMLVWKSRAWAWGGRNGINSISIKPCLIAWREQADVSTKGWDFKLGRKIQVLGRDAEMKVN